MEGSLWEVVSELGLLVSQASQEERTVWTQTQRWERKWRLPFG